MFAVRSYGRSRVRVIEAGQRPRLVSGFAVSRSIRSQLSLRSLLLVLPRPSAAALRGGREGAPRPNGAVCE
jgi:hypothetical protein